MGDIQLTVATVILDHKLLIVGVVLLEADIGSQLVVLGFDPVVMPL